LNVANFDALRRGLRELGYVEGRNYLIEYRSADGRAERFAGLAAELVALPVDIIVTRGTPAAIAAKQATATTPVVMAAIGEPLGTGVVARLTQGGFRCGVVSLIRPPASACSRSAKIVGRGWRAARTTSFLRRRGLPRTRPVVSSPKAEPRRDERAGFHQPLPCQVEEHVRQMAN
jgi:hypothetical protein